MLKAEVRAILLSLGRVATKREFCDAYFGFNGKSINEILDEFKISLTGFFQLMPDVCRLGKDDDGEITISQVSDEATKHMDHLTVKKKKRYFKIAKLVIFF